MITIKNKAAIRKMAHAGKLLVEIFDDIAQILVSGISTHDIDSAIEKLLHEKDLQSRTKGYMGYRHVSCISVNDEVVHGVPSKKRILQEGDLVKIDVCASWKGYCADMARTFYIGRMPSEVAAFVKNAQSALDKGISQAWPGNRLGKISWAIQQEIEKSGFGIVQDFAGHGIGKQMHEEPEILNVGDPDEGPVLRAGMAFAIEPMTTMGKHNVYITEDGWTVKTSDKSLAAHVEDTVVVTERGPVVITRKSDAASAESDIV